MNINMQFRSQRVELDVYNKDGLMAPGMYVDVLFNAKGNPSAVVVPSSAVITSTERKYILVVRDRKAHKVDVSTGNESAGKIEVFGKIQAGEIVIRNANDEIKEGSLAD
jgi:multidrug efflux pump subunit AcrA (membrane-fusion protein)